MLLCQDEARNRARKPNAEKKKRGEEVKLGRRATSQGICYLLSFSYIQVSAPEKCRILPL
jgi:hypothetical protein